MTTKPKGAHTMDELRLAKWEGLDEDKKAFVLFAYALAFATSVSDINVAAGMFLQKIGFEEPDNV